MKKAFEIKFTQHYKKTTERLKKAPRLLEIYIDTMLKSVAQNYIKIFQDGIRKNRFNLIKLKPATIKAKKLKGYKRPSTPLYGKGDDTNKSLINALLIKKIKNGWRVYPRWSKHHEANMEIRKLLYIHENGCLIKHGKSYIRILPRPVLKLTYDKMIREFQKQGEGKKLSIILARYFKTGDESRFQGVKREIND